MEEYPASWEPLVGADNGICPDITGKYYSSYDLTKIVRQIIEDNVSVVTNPEIIEFIDGGEKLLRINGYQDSDLVFSQDVEIGCTSGFVSVVLESEVGARPPLYIGYGQATVHFGKTRSHQLVAELSAQAVAMIGMIVPVVGGESEWFKFQPVETENVTDPDALFVLGKENPFKSRRQFIWFCRAAIENHAVARFLLASRFYEQAETKTPSTRKRTYLWYSLTAGSGDEDALTRLKALKHEMDASEVNDADKIVKSWKSNSADCFEEASRLSLTS